MNHSTALPMRALLGVGATCFALAGTTAAPAQVWEVDDRFLAVNAPGFLHGAAIAVADHDGDGRDDLVVGAPGSNSGGTDAGAFGYHLAGAGRTMNLHAFAVGEPGDRTGTAVVAGDFDADGTPDIAIGAPGRDVEYGPPPAIAEAGGVWIYEWNAVVSTPSFRDFLSQDAAPGGEPEGGDQFGRALVSGDFNHDGFDDLAVGVPYEDAGATPNTGVVHVFYGSATGLRTDNSVTFRAGFGGVLGTESAGDLFGWSLAAGDFDDDDFDDLAIGAPFRDVAGEADAGQVHVLYGSASGLTASGDQLFDDGDFGSAPLAGTRFGWSLAVGQFDQTGLACFVACEDDLAIGAPYRPVLSVADAGTVVVAYGSPSGLTNVDATTLTRLVAQQLPGTGDLFGYALAAGHLDRSAAGSLFAIEDLAVGSIGETAQGVADAGGVYLFFGASAGIGGGSPPWQKIVAREGLGIGAPDPADHFGWTVAIGDFDGDGWGDLVAGAPYDDHAGYGDAGGVQLLYGALFADGFESGTTGGWESSGVAP